MPNRNGTGPQGEGPNTGRGAGPCDSEEELEKTVNWKLFGRGRKRRLGPKDGSGDGTSSNNGAGRMGRGRNS